MRKKRTFGESTAATDVQELVDLVCRVMEQRETKPPELKEKQRRLLNLLLESEEAKHRSKN